MSFLCDNCKQTSPPRTRMNKIIIKKRERAYYNIIIRHKLIKKERYMQFERKDQQILENLERQGWKVVNESFSKGIEIVKEKSICEDCNKKLEKNSETF